MNIKHVARAATTALLVSLLAACGHGFAGEYGHYVGGQWRTVMTLKGNGEAELELMGNIMVAKYEVKDGKVYVTGGKGGQTQALRIDENGCIDGGMLFGTLCKKK